MTEIIVRTPTARAVGSFKIPGKPLTVLVPVTKDAYGDQISLSHIVEDVVGLHSDDKTAKVAGARAASQFNQDWPAIRRAQAAARLSAKRPKALLTPVMDNTGEIRGYKVLIAYTQNEVAQFKEHYISRESAEASLRG